MKRVALPAALLTGVLVLAAPLAASAHVHVVPVRAEAGAATDLAFSVPNERDAATTIGVRIAIPAGLGRPEPKAVPGWTDRVVAVSGGSAVEFRADGAGIGQDASQTFVVHVPEVPSVGSVPLPVVQTCSDGVVVRWDEPTPASGEEPEHPAPTLYVHDDPPADHDEDAGVEAAPAPADLALPIGLSAAALVVALGALAVGAVALLRRR